MSNFQGQDDIIRLLALGDCNTSGSARLPPGNSVPDKVAQLVERRGMAVQLQNFGYTMTTTREGVARLQHHAKPIDLLIINYGLVDAWITALPRIYIPYYPDSRLRRRMRKLLKSVKRRLRSPRLRRIIPVGHVVPLDEYERNISRIIHLAKAHNPGVFIMLWSTPPTLHNPERNRHLMDYDASLARLANGRDIRFLDTRALLAGSDAATAYLDDVHLSAFAAQKVASAIADAYFAWRQV